MTFEPGAPWRSQFSTTTPAKSSLKKVVFRKTDGTAVDLTATAKVAYKKDGSTETLEINVDNPNLQDKKVNMTAFNITVTGDGKEKDYFGGKFTGKGKLDGQKDVELLGKAVSTSNTPIKTVLEPPKDVDERAMTFHHLSPLEGTGKDEHDAVRALAGRFLRELFTHALDDEARSYFFQSLEYPFSNELKDKYFSGNFECLDPKPLLSLSSVLSQNNRVLSVGGVHFVCRELRSANWLDNEYKGPIKDKVEKFFNLVRTPRNADAQQKSRVKGDYGSSDPASNESDELQRQYANASTRCYYIAYMVLRRADWAKLLQNASDIYSVVKAFILSDAYREHFVAPMVDNPDVHGEVSINDQLKIIANKISLLGAVAGVQDSEVDDIVDKLSKAVRKTGLLRTNLTDANPEDNTFNLTEIYPERNGMSNQVFGQFLQAGENTKAKNWLEEVAKPLGLYDPPRSEIVDNVQGVVDDMASVGVFGPKVVVEVGKVAVKAAEDVVDRVSDFFHKIL